MTTVTLYGIKNCDTMKKALAWCVAHDVAHVFHDYRKDGVEAARLARWCTALGWQALVNTRGTTWRKLSPEQQTIAGDDEAIALMLAQPSLIRRPVIETATGELLVGFDAERYAAALQTSGSPQ